MLQYKSCLYSWNFPPDKTVLVKAESRTKPLIEMAGNVQSYIWFYLFINDFFSAGKTKQNKK